MRAGSTRIPSADASPRPTYTRPPCTRRPAIENEPPGGIHCAAARPAWTVGRPEERVELRSSRSRKGHLALMASRNRRNSIESWKSRTSVKPNQMSPNIDGTAPERRPTSPKSKVSKQRGAITSTAAPVRSASKMSGPAATTVFRSNGSTAARYFVNASRRTFVKNTRIARASDAMDAAARISSSTVAAISIMSSRPRPPSSRSGQSRRAPPRAGALCGRR